MEFFGTLDAVAAEELAIFDYSRQVLLNADDIAGKYLAGREFVTYSLTSKAADYFAATKAKGLEGQALAITTPAGTLNAEVAYIGKQGAKFALAAAAAADMLGVKSSTIAQGLTRLKHFAGRMQVLPGAEGVTLIDDTYNASPLAAKAALDVLYVAKTSQRIAILGSMNELGDYSRQAHEEVGAYCDPKKLDVVVTIGADAEKWLAPAAKKQGCTVHSFASPYEAGAFVRSHLKPGAVVLAKGSQNGVFAEEALKQLLADSKDASKLVRQSAHWLKVKSQQFPARPQ
jgi:UDP-N-acetylmuramoyl-tripeptide--D-alanyl-D-alanine ligase